MSQAYPLHWPAGWPRTALAQRKPAAFGKMRASGYGREALTVAGARGRLSRELGLLDASNPVLSTNVELRLDGQPRSDRRDPDDPGAAVYFSLGGRPMALACDRWDRVADNIAALAKHIEALRGMDRWGVGTTAQAFTGYQALPSPDAVPPASCWAILGIEPTRDPAKIRAAFRTKAAEHHPDRGGMTADMTALIQARDQAMQGADLEEART